jgi:hypothetical protein
MHRSGTEPPSARCSLVVVDRESDVRIGEIDLVSVDELTISSGVLRLFRSTGCRNLTATFAVRCWRYVLAWIHARRSAGRGDALRMGAADLRCLNVDYMIPRPVFLVGVAHEDRANLFPMDLVGRVGSGDYLLALRATSPAIELMEASRVIAMSAAPAEHLTNVYALGAHHRLPTVDTSALPFEVHPGGPCGTPILSNGFTRALTVLNVHRVGSHVLFVCRVDSESGRTPRQLAHVSLMYVEWLARHGRTLDVLA